MHCEYLHCAKHFVTSPGTILLRHLSNLCEETALIYILTEDEGGSGCISYLIVLMGFIAVLGFQPRAAGITGHSFRHGLVLESALHQCLVQRYKRRDQG